MRLLVRGIVVLVLMAAWGPAVAQAQYARPAGTYVDPSTRAWFQQASVQQGFTNLGSNYVVLAPATPSYNCIAHAVDINYRWEWPGYTVSNHDSLFAQHGYTRTASMDFSHQRNAQKVVLYGKATSAGTIEVTHSAKQTSTGWTSKLGQGPLIWHPTPYSVAGPTYGQPIAVYVR